MFFYHEYLPKIIDIAKQAGNEILKISQQDFAVNYKDDQSPVTAADLAANAVITPSLSQLNTAIPIVSEESTGNIQATNQPFWLVDPLDGTREFVKKSDEYVVCIALIQDFYPVLGVIYAPATGELYYAAQGLGAFCETPTQAKKQIQVRVFDANRPCRVARSRSHLNAETQEYLKKITDFEEIVCGSALKFGRLAAGKVDLYPRLGPTCQWDTAAGQAILECAGGVVCTTTGERLDYRPRTDFLNPHFIAAGDVAWLADSHTD